MIYIILPIKAEKDTKKLLNIYTDSQYRKPIILNYNQYIEQIYKGTMITNEDKLNKAKEKALEWLNSKGLKISDTELDILIESAVNGLKKEV